MRRCHKLLVLSLMCVFVVSSPSISLAQGSGKIAGKVVDAATGQPLAFASVVVLGTTLGATALSDGSFVINKVPVGVHSVRAMMMGYDTATRADLSVDADRTSSVEFSLHSKVAATLDEIRVKGQREQIDFKSSSTKHVVEAKELTQLPVDSFQEAIALRSGIVAQGGELHFRGGRTSEVLYMVDGIPVRDPLVGGAVDLATMAMSESEILVGGLDAQYGNAQSGIVNVSTREGGSTFSGEMRFLTDDYGAKDKTYDNFDRISVGFGGPFFVKDMTYFMSYDGTFTDTYLKTSELRSRYRLLDFISLGNRQNNESKFQGKLAYNISSNHKLTAEYVQNYQLWDSYLHMWSRDGYVQTMPDTATSGEIKTLYGDWSWYKVDSTYVAYNPAEHTPDNLNEFRQLKLVWKQKIRPNLFYTAKVSRHSYYFVSSVLGKKPWEYSIRYPQYWYNWIEGTVEPFYVTHGDFPAYTERATTVWTSVGDVTATHRGHTLQSGYEATYNDMRLLSIRYPEQTNAQGLYGALRSDYHYYNPEGAFYVQDKWEHEGMVLNIGLRYDVFSVGDQIDASEITDRVKDQISPRIGIAYPISDRDVLSFHYGRYYQIPNRQYIFEDRASTSAVITRGNPDLTNETTVSYQAAVQHMFTSTVFGQFSVYYKDIFGLLSAQERVVADSPQPVYVYVNQDYASSRGFELTLRKRFSYNFAGELSYTYGLATGVASDPDAQTRTPFLYLPIAEQPLDWDQRHTVSAQLQVSVPEEWSVSFVWRYGTGFPYTPVSRDQRVQDPSLVNSKRLPSSTTLDMQADKTYRLWGQHLTVFMQAMNLLDAKNIADLAPTNWPVSPYSDTDDYIIYYTETGRAGGAYNAGDVNGDGLDDYYPVNDPRVWDEGTSVRIGVGIQF
ncbi:MAG: TonB-dependent receptor [Candidatus Eisenbacteria bacterium]|nr:TonB-dependent receptor [Candidatus Eisenbacteria bacterium]